LEGEVVAQRQLEKPFRKNDIWVEYGDLLRSSSEIGSAFDAALSDSRKEI